MRIAIVGTELCAVDERGGGLEQVLRRWAAGLAAAHDVAVVSHRSPVRGSDPYDVIAVERTRDIGAALAAWRPDVVSLHNRPQWADLAPADSAVGVTFHNYPVAWKMRHPPRRHPGLSAVSGALAGAAGEVTPGAVAVVAPSIDPAFFAAPRWRPAPVVLSPNRLLRKKGPLILLAVARRPEFRDVRFDFTDVISPWARPTAEHRAMRAAIRATPNARLVPPAGPADLAERMAAAGVVVCPVTEPEGLGLVALEAQACGAPLVASDAGGLAEATLPPNRLVPPGDARALADAIREALDDPPVRATARRAVRRRYAPAASVASMERWLVRLASRRAG